MKALCAWTTVRLGGTAEQGLAVAQYVLALQPGDVPGVPVRGASRRRPCRRFRGPSGRDRGDPLEQRGQLHLQLLRPLGPCRLQLAPQSRSRSRQRIFAGRGIDPLGLGAGMDVGGEAEGVAVERRPVDEVRASRCRGS